jgi:hypothetical protein
MNVGDLPPIRPSQGQMHCPVTTTLCDEEMTNIPQCLPRSCGLVDLGVVRLLPVSTRIWHYSFTKSNQGRYSLSVRLDSGANTAILHER